MSMIFLHIAHQNSVNDGFIGDLKNGEGDLVLMSIDAFERREAIIDLKEKLLIAEEQRLSGEKTISLDSAYQRIMERIDDKL